MKNVIRQIQNICENATGNIYDIYYSLYKECMFNQPDPSDILQKIIIEMQNQESADERDAMYIDINYIDEIVDIYFDLLKAYVITLVHKNLEETEFYERLYKVVFESDLFLQEEKAQAIYLYLLSEKIPEIPYFQAKNLLEMDGEEYREAVQRLKPQIEKSIAVLNRHFKSRTQESSQIYKIIEEIDSREDRIVFLSVYTSIIQNNAVLSIKEKE